MAIVQINYDTKSNINTTATPSQNKVSANDMNEIKSVVNTNATSMGDLANLNTTDKTSVVNAINEVITNSDPVTLWTNPSPNNNFAATQVTLSSGNYDFLEIYYYEWSGDSNSWKDLKCAKVIKGYNTVLEAIISRDGKGYKGARRVRYINATTLQVDTCYSLIIGSAFLTTSVDAFCVPVKILGYK